MHKAIFSFLLLTTFPLLAETPLSMQANLPRMALDTPFSWQPKVEGGNPPYRFGIVGGELPPGLVLNESTGQIVGIPSQLGKFSFTLEVTQSGPGRLTREFQADVIQPLRIRSLSLPSPLLSGSSYAIRLESTGGTEPITWSFNEALPPNATIVKDEIRWTPQSASEGPSTFSITALDANNWSTTSKVPYQVFAPITVTPGGIIQWNCPAFKANCPSFPSTSLLVDTYPPGGPVQIGSEPDNVTFWLYGNPCCDWLAITPRSVTAPARIQTSVDFSHMEQEVSGAIALLTFNKQLKINVQFIGDALSPEYSEPLANQNQPASPATDPSVASIVASLPRLELWAHLDASTASAEFQLRPTRDNVSYAILSSHPWLSVDTPTAGLKAAQIIRVAARTAGLRPGLHEAVLSIYDETGQVVSTVAVALRLTTSHAPVLLDHRHLTLSATKPSTTLRLRNPNPRPVAYHLRADQDQFAVSPSSGTIPAFGEVALAVQATNASNPEALSANLVLSFDHHRLELVTLAWAPSTCAIHKPAVRFLHPGEHYQMPKDSTLTIRAAAFDGCGEVLNQGELHVVAPDGTPISLERDAQGYYHGSWQPSPGASSGGHLLLATWRNPASSETASRRTQIDLVP